MLWKTPIETKGGGVGGVNEIGSLARARSSVAPLGLTDCSHVDMPSLDALSVWSDVISSIHIFSLGMLGLRYKFVEFGAQGLAQTLALALPHSARVGRTFSC